MSVHVNRTPGLVAPGVSRGSRTLIVLLSSAMVGAVIFWLGAALPYLSTSRDSFGPNPEVFWDRRFGLWLHIAGGTLAMFTGPVQLWLGETRRRLDLHRVIGLSYLFGVGLGCAAAFYLSLTTPIGFVFASGLFGMAVACVVSTAMAYAAIRLRNFRQHREWMIRSYVVILAFVFFRMIFLVLTAMGTGGTGAPGDALRLGVAAWSSWACPLFVTEFFLQLPKLKQARP